MRSWSPLAHLDHIDLRGRTPVIFCVDVEPDPRVFDRKARPQYAGFERLVEWIPRLRERLSNASGEPAMFTWFLRMDPQVRDTWGSPLWLADRYGAELAELMQHGDDVGLHTHLWRWDSQAQTWIADHEDPTWAEHCVGMGLDAFKTAFGRVCAAHRGGDHFLSSVMLSVLDRYRVTVDLTVEPGQPPLGPDHYSGEIARGSLPDYRGVPARPYRSSSARFPHPDAVAPVDPLLIPLLSAPSIRPPFRRGPLTVFESSNRFKLRLAAELRRSPPPVIALAVRSDVALSERNRDGLSSRLEHLAQQGRMVFTTVVRGLDQEFRQRSGV